MYGYVGLCMGNVWVYIALYSLYSYVWLYMGIYDYVGLCKAIYCYVGLCMAM